MNKYIAYCGLNCEKCEARIATINNDDELREKVAKKWSELNQVEITKEMINCVGCRVEGVKFPYCESMCEIKICSSSKNFETCRDCKNLDSCKKIELILNSDDEANNNLKGN